MTKRASQHLNRHILGGLDDLPLVYRNFTKTT
jgi:hypothetical protein